jgi:hypothetical protein
MTRRSAPRHIIQRAPHSKVLHFISRKIIALSCLHLNRAAVVAVLKAYVWMEKERYIDELKWNRAAVSGSLSHGEIPPAFHFSYQVAGAKRHHSPF